MKYLKNIPYLDFKQQDKVLPILYSMLGGGMTAGVHLTMATYVQTKRGVLLSVDKDLSDELTQTDIHGITSKDLVVMFPSMEIYFEDPAFPTMLFYVKDKEYYDLTSRYLGMDYKRDPKIPDEKGFCLDYYEKNGYCHTVQLPQSMLDAWLDGSDEMGTIPGYENDDASEQQKREFFFLLIKLFLYCSIPEYHPRQISRKHLHHGGKPGVRNRPRTPIFKVFLPSRTTERLRKTTDGSGSRNTSPHQRRGHLRKLTSERFTKKRGQIIYIRPTLIHGGSTGDRIMVARKKGDAE